MNKGIILSISSLLLLGSCGTYTGEGAYAGATMGSVLGSAIGGISGGWRGSDVGTIVGMAGGAMVGAAVGSAADKAQQDKYQQYQQQRDANFGRNNQQQDGYYGENQQNQVDDSGFDASNSGDDRITFDQAPAGNAPVNKNVYTTVPPRTYDPKTVSLEQLRQMTPGYNVNYNSQIELRNASFVDRDGNGVIHAGEECKVTFDIMNRSSVVLYDVQPTVIETTGNKHIHISPSIRIESIQPNKGIRYTATVYADKRLKSGTAIIRAAVAQGQNDITSQVKEFQVVTERK